MFLKLHNKIVRTIVLLSLCFTLLIGAVSLTISGVSLYRRFAAFSEENAEQGISESRFYITTAESAAGLIVGNEQILTSLKEGKDDPTIGSALDMLLNTSYSIAGATLYAADGKLYTSRNISSCPTLLEMAQNEEIGAFLTGQQTTLLSVRQSPIAAIYNDIKYDPSHGMITFITRLRDASGETLGYLFSDVNPEYIYDNFFSFDEYPGFYGTESFIFLPNGGYLVSPRNEEGNAALAAAALGAKPHAVSAQYYAVSKPLFGSAALVTLSPLSGFYQDFSVILSAVAGVTAILNVTAWLIARALSRRVTVPLGELQRKMQTDTIASGKNAPEKGAEKTS